jgi:succinylarginine dihydrolase
VHLFAWGRRAFGEAPRPARFPARQTLEATLAIARLHALDPNATVLVQQDPAGIDAGAFHTDVLAVGNESFLMVHDLAFVNGDAVVADLRSRLGEGLSIVRASNTELPVADAVSAYPFNSQVLRLPDGTMTIVAPEESRETPSARAFLDRVVAESGCVKRVEYVDLRESMNNGGGPACLRLRVPLTEDEISAVKARVFFDAALERDLESWIGRRYRDRLLPRDLGDPALAREVMTALDELTQILRLGNVYDVQA